MQCIVYCYGSNVFLFIGGSIAGYPQREAPYNTGPNEPYSEVLRSFAQEPSQRLFWGNQGTNSVGGTGLWAHLTNKYPFLGNMFGRLELPSQSGPPNQYNVPSTQYGAPIVNEAQYNSQQQQEFYQQPQQFYQQPQRFYQQPQQVYQQPQQFFRQPQQVYQQVPQRFGQRFVPSARDVGITDDAVIVTPPFVSPVAEPAPAPIPIPAPAPVPVPVPAPAPIPAEPAQGYSYNKPQFRLELPHK